MFTATIDGFVDELQKIEKDAGLGRNLLGGLAMTGALAGGVKAMAPTAAKSLKPAMSQTLAQGIKAAKKPHAMSQFADPDVASAMSFR